MNDLETRGSKGLKELYKQEQGTVVDASLLGADQNTGTIYLYSLPPKSLEKEEGQFIL